VHDADDEPGDQPAEGRMTVRPGTIARRIGASDRTFGDLGVTVPATSPTTTGSCPRSEVAATLPREEGVHTMAHRPSLEDRCLGLPSIRDLAWVAAHFGHR